MKVKLPNARLLLRIFVLTALAAQSIYVAFPSDSGDLHSSPLRRFITLADAANRVSDFRMVQVDEKRRSSNHYIGLFIKPMWSESAIFSRFKIPRRFRLKPTNKNDPTEIFGDERGIVYIYSRGETTRLTLFSTIVHEATHVLLTLGSVLHGGVMTIFSEEARSALQKSQSGTRQNDPFIRLLNEASNLANSLEPLVKELLPRGGKTDDIDALQEFVTYPLGILSIYSLPKSNPAGHFPNAKKALRNYVRRMSLRGIRPRLHRRAPSVTTKLDVYIGEIEKIAPEITSWIAKGCPKEEVPTTSNEAVRMLLSIVSSLFSFSETILSKPEFHLEEKHLLSRPDFVEKKIREAQSIPGVGEILSEPGFLLEHGPIVGWGLHEEDKTGFVNKVMCRTLILKKTHRVYSRQYGEVITPASLLSGLAL